MHFVLIPALFALISLSPQDPSKTEDKRPEQKAETIWEYLVLKYDSNKDGRVSKAEYKRSDENWIRLDKNADGFLSEDEFEDQGQQHGRPSGGQRGREGEMRNRPEAPKVGEPAPDFKLLVLNSTIARMASGHREPVREVFSVEHWSREILGRLARSARSHQIEWSVALPTEDFEVRGDPQHLALALSNLVDNAIPVLAGSETPKLEVAISCAGNDWTMAVTDNGPGIPKEHLPHLFRRFYRADEHRDRESGGVGLGLSLVQAVAEAHGGKASIKSRHGEGTRVTITIPIDSQDLLRSRICDVAGSMIPHVQARVAQGRRGSHLRAAPV